ncbi:MAG: hypothetical protein KJ574_04975 [Nanoarchaeota archaeon]|nr:hypothetical protein [Nanoarchaeota archaeon]
MLEAKDIISMIIGIIITAVGVLPLLYSFGIGPDFFDLDKLLSVTVISWVLAVAALYLVYDSVIEITNSNAIGWISIIIAFVVLALGILPILETFGIGPGLFGIAIPQMVYHIVFIIEGVFLMIAGFAMEM